MGAGFKTFTAGSILTASDVQNYLQDQSVMVFGGTAARSSAIGTANFEEGMLTYLTDVDKLQVYTGASFVDVYPAAATNQGLTLINTTSFSAVASQSINNVFSATYDNYRIVVNVSGNSNNDGDQYIRLRSGGTDLTASSYAYTSWIKRADTAADVSWTASPSTFIKLGAQDNVEKQGQAYLIDIISPFLTQWTKFTGTIVSQNDSSAFIGGSVGGLVFVTTSYDGFTLITQNGTFTGTVSVYGYNK